MKKFYKPAILSVHEKDTIKYPTKFQKTVYPLAEIVDQNIDLRDPLQIEIDQLLGQWAACKYLNVFQDMGIVPSDSVYKGLHFDVITIPFRKAKSLQVPQHKEKGDTDIFILVEVEKNQAHILGFAPREDVFRSENLKPSVREGKFHYELPWAQLNPIGKLDEYTIPKS